MPDMAMAEETICSMLHDAWDERTPVVWPNILPAPADHPREGKDPWVALHIVHTGSDQHTLAEEGRRIFTRQGMLTAQIFVPAGQRGLADATALAMAALNAYEGKHTNGVRFFQSGVKTVGVSGQSPWFQINVVSEFEFDEVK